MPKMIKLIDVDAGEIFLNSDKVLKLMPAQIITNRRPITKIILTTRVKGENDFIYVYNTIDEVSEMLNAIPAKSKRSQ